MDSYILAIDQGTTSTRSIVFDAHAVVQGAAQQEFRQIFPHPGWIEHDGEELWETSLQTARQAIDAAGIRPAQIAGIGIANQRETTVVWSRASGRPIHNAIVWQDRRTAAHCARLVEEGFEEMVRSKTGLLLDPYFSATKIGWLLDQVEGARALAERGELLFGTVDTFLLWRFTDGQVHATDVTNASRTSLFNIHSLEWDEELLALFEIPRAMLPEVRDTAGEFGVLAAGHLGARIPVRAIAGDQQSALIGQACLAPGMVKATFGTGGFILLNTGSTPVNSSHRMLTSLGYRWSGVAQYVLEGSIFAAGATVQWLRDSLGVIESSAHAGQLAGESDPEQSVYLVPAFAGLGAPHWRSTVRGLITGFTRGTTRKELARAALECLAYQTKDLLLAMYADFGGDSVARSQAIIRVDGGMSASDWTMQFLADMLDAPVDRAQVQETTALGVALLAGWRAGVSQAPEELPSNWRLGRRFAPQMGNLEREQRYRGWRDAVARTLLEPGG